MSQGLAVSRGLAASQRLAASQSLPASHTSDTELTALPRNGGTLILVEDGVGKRRHRRYEVTVIARALFTVRARARRAFAPQSRWVNAPAARLALITSLAVVARMNLSLPRALQTRLLLEPCAARWEGVACALPAGHAGPHESGASHGGCALTWRSSRPAVAIGSAPVRAR